MTDQAPTEAVVDPDLLAMIREVVAAHATSAEPASAPADLDDTLWARIDALGLIRLTTPEEDGGSGATWHESAALIGELARAAVHQPVGEHDLLSDWLLRAVGLPSDGRRRTVALFDAEGIATAVPWARSAHSIVCAWPTEGSWQVADVPLPLFGLTHGTNLAGEPRDDLRIGLGSITGSAAASHETMAELRLRAALVRGVQVSAALEACLARTVEHATTRIQFGRPIARFQAVQHAVAEMAAETSLCRAATDAAVATAARRDQQGASLAELALAVAVARSCAGHAASVVVRKAHQLHGAIGTTLEHSLHRSTLSALAWRSEYGSTQHWDGRVAALASEAGQARLWALITG